MYFNLKNVPSSQCTQTDTFNHNSIQEIVCNSRCYIHQLRYAFIYWNVKLILLCWTWTLHSPRSHILVQTSSLHNAAAAAATAVKNSHFIVSIGNSTFQCQGCVRFESLRAQCCSIELSEFFCASARGRKLKIIIVTIEKQNLSLHAALLYNETQFNIYICEFVNLELWSIFRAIDKLICKITTKLKRCGLLLR